MMPKPTTEKLAEALEAVPGMPPEMVERARSGYYDDYKTELAAPQIQLVSDLRKVVRYHPAPTRRFRLLVMALIRDVTSGEFDSTREEAEAWGRSPEGRATFGGLFGGR